MTSELNTSQSSDLACWRWMKAVRCWSADAENSVRLAFQPWAPYLALKLLMRSLPMPVVSLPWQNLTVPLGGLFSEFGSMALAPEIFVPPPPPLVLAAPPPPPVLPPLSLLPQATTNIAIAASNAAANLLRETIARTPSSGPRSGPVCTSRAPSQGRP